MTTTLEQAREVLLGRICRERGRDMEHCLHVHGVFIGGKSDGALPVICCFCGVKWSVVGGETPEVHGPYFFGG